VHRSLVERARAQRAARWLLVHEHGALAVGARTLAHRGRLCGFVRHRGRARGERSRPASARFRTTLNRGVGRRAPSALQRSWRLGVDDLLYPVRGNLERPTPDEGGPPGGRPRWSGLERSVELGGLAAPALAARHIAVHRLVLPAILPFVVSRQLGATARLRADAIAFVLPIRPRERPDRGAPVPLL
jgi:hypothetical protein